MRMLVLYRNAGEIGHRFDLWTRHDKGNQIVRVVRRHGCRLLGIAGLSGFDKTQSFGIISFFLLWHGAALQNVRHSGHRE
jgi:hypothetical protein